MNKLEEFKSLEEMEYEHILRVLNAYHWNRAVSARTLNISLRALQYKITELKARGVAVKENEADELSRRVKKINTQRLSVEVLRKIVALGEGRE